MLMRIRTPLILLAIFTLPLLAQELQYRTVQIEPEIEAMKAELDSLVEELEAETENIRDRQWEEDRQARLERQVLAIDWDGIKKPGSPEEFKQIWHFPPTRQYLTGTCWSFATTSFLESEINRQYGKKIKLSEMFTVYNEYLLKAGRYVKERGDSYLGQGSEANAVTRVWQEYGAVPRDIYPGVTRTDGRFQQKTMFQEIEAYLDWIDDQDFWDETLVTNSVKVIMERYLGQPPNHFIYDGVEYTPVEFLEEILWVDVDDYVCLVSTKKYPFYEFCEFEVPDNWWLDNSYYNVPLSEFYSIVETASKMGYSVLIGGDISEPGIDVFQDAAIIPSFDIPAELISQDSRELRFYNESTTDDHLIHIVGHKKIGKDNWFLIKDSGSGAYMGQHPGYYFYREDYIKMKMLLVMVHKEIVQKVVKEFD